jgi:CBS domain containing-hemolysin-like protein
VSVEDIVEEIVGEIEDEYDLPDDTLTWVDDETVLVAGSMTIDDFNEAVGTDLSNERARTMAGLVFNELGRRPEPADVVAVDGVRLPSRSSTACASPGCRSLPAAADPRCGCWSSPTWPLRPSHGCSSRATRPTRS